MNFISKQSGMTFVELMLVIAIGALMLLIGIRQYQIYKVDSDVAELKYNVDQLFEAMGHYYHANCRNTQIYAVPPISYLPVDITTDLKNNFLPQNWPALNPLIDNTSYVAQFNSVTSNRNVSACFPYSSPVCSAPTAIKAQNSVIVWTAQIAVSINDTANIQVYKNLLAADCISSLNGKIVTPCNATPTAGSYLVWTRLPSFASPNASSSLWMSMPGLKQFTQQYTNDDNYALNVDDSSWNTTSGYENYLCGG